MCPTVRPHYSPSSWIWATIVDVPARPYAEWCDMCLPQFVVLTLLCSDPAVLPALSGASVIFCYTEPLTALLTVSIVQE